MRAAPILYGGFPLRFAWLVFGLFLCACGVACFLESELGLPPWDVLHQGLAEQTRLSFGAANIAVSLVVIAIAAALRARIGLGTVLNATLIGTFVIGLTAIDAVDELSESALPGRIALMLFALVLFGVGSALYIGADLGAGPRDTLMVVISQRSHVRLGVSRTAIEIVALALGVVLGGTVGVGTLVFALGIGPSVEVSFRLLARTPLAMPEVASAA